MAFQLCALIISVLIISLLILKGLHPILSVIIGCSLMIWTNGLPYAATFTSGLESWGAAMMPTIFVTLLGAAFGVLYTKCGAIDSLARFLMKPSGLMKSANGKIVMCILGLVAFRVVLGIAGFANEAIIVTMLAVSGVIFRTADVDRRHLPALTAFAASVGTCLPGAPTMINVFLQLNLPGYSATAYFIPRLILWILFVVLFCLFMTIWLARDRRKGAHFEPGNMILPELADGAKLPPVWLCFIPILVVIVIYSVVGLDAWISIGIGVIAAILCLWKYYPVDENSKTRFGSVLEYCGQGVMLIPIQLMLMVLPTMILTQSPAFTWGVEALAESGLPMVVSLAIIVLIMMFFAGLGGVPAICPTFLNVFMPSGISMYTFAALVTWGVAFSGGLPTNASITVESNLADCSVKKTYPSIFIGSICTAVILYILAILTGLMGVWG
ncbi:hypothetical protein [Lawsonibacter hominis]|uniref:Uncharacterized protein n=1 Tax=Lawsonibacter hominis TaxID=2763053 RepID=A0A8J6JFL0_9FIRM|nr:hypothetical protein [Lawsonibacter hominis]MBC5734319.1 hypothetical protein [Lawsonibacter hominis]